MRFNYWGQTLNSFDHPYNTTTKNERAIEIAVAAWWLSGVELSAGLEVGNVMSHYCARPAWVRVDKYERAPGVDNVDLFEIAHTYPWVLSISTIEHVGKDDPAYQDPEGGVKALNYLMTRIQPGGRALVTVPIGWNLLLDQAIFDRLLPAELHRDATFIREGGTWVQTPELVWRPYGWADPWAGAVWIAEFERSQ